MNASARAARRRRAGLTRIGALVLFVLFASLWLCVFTALVPGLARAQRSATRSRCYNDLRMLGLAALQYADDERAFPHLGPRSVLDGGTDTPATTKAVRTLLWRGYHDRPQGWVCVASADIDVPITDAAVREDLRRWFWGGAARGDPERPPFSDGLPDPALDATDELSYGWTRRALGANVRSSSALAADRAQHDPERAEAPPGERGNHEDGAAVVRADGTVEWVAGGEDAAWLAATEDPVRHGFLAVRPPLRPAGFVRGESVARWLRRTALPLLWTVGPPLLLAGLLAWRVRVSERAPPPAAPPRVVVAPSGRVAPVRPSRVETLGPDERQRLGLGAPGGAVVLHAAQRCPTCHDQVRADEPLSRCGGCRAVFHADCVAPGAPCPTLGCGG